MRDRDPMDHVASAARRDPEFYRAFRAAMSGDPRDSARAAVEMNVLTIRAGDAWTPEYLVLPAHLPETEGDMRALLASTVKADAELKRGLVEWADANRLRQDRAAKALENLIHALRGADAILHDPDSTDEELMGWRDEIAAHVRRHYSVEIDDAPVEKVEIEGWSWYAAGHNQPTPYWLFTNEDPRRTFDPRRGRHTGPRTVAAAIAANGNFTPEQGED